MAAGTCLVWFVPLAIAWRVDLGLTVTPDAMRAVAGSSIDLAALTLAVAGLLHGLAWQDRLFRLLLLVCGVVFAGTALAAYLVALTMGDSAVIARVTGWVVLLVCAAAVLQLGGLYLAPRAIVPGTRGTRVPWSGWLHRHRRIQLAPILALLLLLPFTSLDAPATLVLIAFMGGLSNLVALMSVTTLKSILADAPANEQVRERKLKSSIRAAVEELVQELRIEASWRQGKDTRTAPPMIDTASLVQRLRARGIRDNRERIREAVRELASEHELVLFDDPPGGSRTWTLPDRDDARQLTELLDSIPALVVSKAGAAGEASFLTCGLDFGPLRSYILSRYFRLPTEILDEYLMPIASMRFLDSRLDPESGALVKDYLTYRSETLRLFIRFDWHLRSDEAIWESLFKELEYPWLNDNSLRTHEADAIVRFAQSAGLVCPPALGSDGALWLAKSLLDHAPGWKETITTAMADPRHDPRSEINREVDEILRGVDLS